MCYTGSSTTAHGNSGLSVKTSYISLTKMTCNHQHTVDRRAFRVFSQLIKPSESDSCLIGQWIYDLGCHKQDLSGKFYPSQPLIDRRSLNQGGYSAIRTRLSEQKAPFEEFKKAASLYTVKNLRHAQRRSHRVDETDRPIDPQLRSRTIAWVPDWQVTHVGQQLRALPVELDYRNGLFLGHCRHDPAEELVDAAKPDMTGVSPISSIFCGTRLFTNVWEMLPRCPISEVRRVRTQFYTLFYLLMLTSTVLAFPKRMRIIDEPNHSIVIFHNQACRPVNSEQLQARMGAAFNRAKMSLDEESVKRSVANNPGSEFDNTDNENADDTDDEPTMSPYTDFEEEEERIEAQEASIDSYKSVMGAGGQMPMRRRKRSANNDIFSDNDEYISLYRSLLERTSHTSHSNAKRKVRNIRSSKQLPWQCKMKTVWKKMKDGYFPPYVQTGKCQSKKCMYDRYQCSPKKYEIKVLKRDSDGCNPLPNLGLNTTYEERWIFDRYHVTVCCECGRRTNKKGGDDRERLKKLRGI
ncbi:hypothetical protein ScPMuIL_006238 [Solemya velum]